MRLRPCSSASAALREVSKKYKLDAPSACKLAEATPKKTVPKATQYRLEAPRNASSLVEALESREDSDEALDKICALFRYSCRALFIGGCRGPGVWGLEVLGFKAQG